MKISKLIISALTLFLVLSFLGCGEDGGSSDEPNTGTLSLSLTDAPLVDEDNVTGVFISIIQIQYHGQDGWHNFDDFNTSMNPINLLDLQEGKNIFLADVDLPSGKYTQIRFLLDAAQENQIPKSNTGCFIQFDGDRNETLYVPSGSQSGYKAIGNFDVPENGTISIMADFDVRKSIVVTGGGSHYKLKPTIRLIATQESGSIEGNITNLNAANIYLMYAYNATDYINVPSAVADDFINAITSTKINDDGSYFLAYLQKGDYDLIIAEYDINGDYVGHNIQIELNVQDETVTRHDFVF